MAEPSDADLRERVVIARDYALQSARDLFAEASAAEDVTSRLVVAEDASTYRAIGRVLNVLLGDDPAHGDPTPPRP